MGLEKYIDIFEERGLTDMTQWETFSKKELTSWLPDVEDYHWNNEDEWCWRNSFVYKWKHKFPQVK